MILLLASVLALGQTTQPSSASAPTQPVQTMVLPAAGVPGVAGPSTNTGTAVIVAPPSAPLVVTPEVHLTTVVPSVGASNATPGNTAGAANATSELPVPPRVITTVPQFAGEESTVTITPPPEQIGATVPSVFNTGVGAVQTVTPGASEVVVSNLFNRGVGPGNGVMAGGNTSGKSLGEIARQYRQRETRMNARLYTNQDIQRIEQQSGTGGTAGFAVGAGTAIQTQPAGTGNAVSQPTQNPASNPGVSQPASPQSPPPSGQKNAVPPSPLSQMQAPQGLPSTTASAKRQLPDGGSVLPMMALVGFLAAGAGLLAR